MAAAGLRIRKLADRSEGTRIPGFNPITGERVLINPETNLPEPWPLLGVEIEGTPETATIPTRVINRGVAEGWIELENPRPAHRPGGPPEEPWRVTHTFIHADVIIFKTPDGEDNVRYAIVHQPDKYADPGDDETPVTPEIFNAGDTRVDWYYVVELAE
jgi:hypothetical protein